MCLPYIYTCALSVTTCEHVREVTPGCGRDNEENMWSPGRVWNDGAHDRKASFIRPLDGECDPKIDDSARFRRHIYLSHKMLTITLFGSSNASFLPGLEESVLRPELHERRLQLRDRRVGSAFQRGTQKFDHGSGVHKIVRISLANRVKPIYYADHVEARDRSCTCVCVDRRKGIDFRESFRNIINNPPTTRSECGAHANDPKRVPPSAISRSHGLACRARRCA